MWAGLVFGYMRTGLVPGSMVKGLRLGYTRMGLMLEIAVIGL